ncbi:MAG: hypothetical protein GYB33_07780 [Gammaproteobacteria bacterium]|nr:hypothetical protein [Gammaproteobacteria bacterium]
MDSFQCLIPASLGNAKRHCQGQVSLQEDASAIEQLARLVAGFECCAVIVRVVHRGPVFLNPIEVGDESLYHLKSMASQAQLHNEIAIGIIKDWWSLDNSIRIFAVFDTQLFGELPAAAVLHAAQQQFFYRLCHSANG